MHTAVQYLNILLAATSSLTGAAAAENARGTSSEWASLVGQRFEAKRDVLYRTVQGRALKLDFYIPYDRKPGPTVLYTHGGGWENGSKEQYVLWYLPYLELGLRVAAVQYRLSGDAPAPAAVEDCACAFRWVVNHASEYGIDPQRVVVTGGSAGGHLALMTAFQPSNCPDPQGPDQGNDPRAAAVINYYGATDLVALLDSPLRSVGRWLRGAAEPQVLAKQLSPVTWVRAGLPPVLTLHGDADRSIPHEQAEKLHQLLSRAGVSNELVTVQGGAHGRHTWTDADTLSVQRSIERFLRRHQILPKEVRR